MSAIRRANPRSKSWRKKLSTLSSDKISNVDLESEPVNPLFDSYPYIDQEVLKGDFTYQLYPPRGDPKDLRMTFYYRTDTDIFILDPGRRDNLANQVLYEFRSELLEEVKILPGSSISRTGVWNFIRSADGIREVIIQDDIGATDSENVSYEEFPPREVVGKKVNKASLVFRHEGRFNVIYSGDTLSINGSDVQFEYAIQKFETEAIYKR